MKSIKAAMTILVCATSSIIWLMHAAQSPFFNDCSRRSAVYLRTLHDELSPNLQQERRLARAYWLRYEDVRKDQLWGEKGVLGVMGPADHYRNHGRQEGRVYAEITLPDDMAGEEKRAEVYWKRYPDVEKSPIWGRNSSLGILGPRDHYHLFGRLEGRLWDE